MTEVHKSLYFQQISCRAHAALQLLCTCICSVCMYTCTLHVHYMYTLHVHYMYTTCIHYMYTTCIHYIHTDYKLTAYTNYAFQTRHKTHQMTTIFIVTTIFILHLCTLECPVTLALQKCLVRSTTQCHVFIEFSDYVLFK